MAETASEFTDMNQIFPGWLRLCPTMSLDFCLGDNLTLLFRLLWL